MSTESNQPKPMSLFTYITAMVAVCFAIWGATQAVAAEKEEVKLTCAEFSEVSADGSDYCKIFPDRIFRMTREQYDGRKLAKQQAACEEDVAEQYPHLFEEVDGRKRVIYPLWDEEYGGDILKYQNSVQECLQVFLTIGITQ